MGNASAQHTLATGPPSGRETASEGLQGLVERLAERLLPSVSLRADEYSVIGDNRGMPAHLHDSAARRERESPGGVFH